MSSVQAIIQVIILFIIVFFAWMIGRAFVLPGINIGIPALPPHAIWQTIYNGIFQLCMFALGFIGGAMLVIYLIYFFFRYIFPPVLIFFPIRKIILSITPIKQLIACGLFPTIDKILFLWLSPSAFISKILGTVNYLIAFLAKSVVYLVRQFASLFGLKPRTIDINADKITVGQGTPETKATTPSTTLSDATGIGVETKSDPNPQFADKIDGEPVDADPDLKINEQKYIESEYQNCLLKNYVATEGEDNLSTMDKVSLQVKNTNAKLLCDVDKLNAYGRIYRSMFNR